VRREQIPEAMPLCAASEAPTPPVFDQIELRAGEAHLGGPEPSILRSDLASDDWNAAQAPAPRRRALLGCRKCDQIAAGRAGGRGRGGRMPAKGNPRTSSDVAFHE